MREVDTFLTLASAVAGHRISVHRSASQDRLAFTDGQMIILPAEGVEHDDQIWRDIVAQSSLIAAGSLAPRLMRQLLGRRQAAERYLYLEVVRASRLIAQRLPTRYSALPEIREGKPVCGSAEASLELALGRQQLPPKPDFFGALRPFAALRRAVGDEGFAALTKRQHKGNIKQAAMPFDELPEDAEAEESKLLKLFANPLVSGGFIADLLNKILGGGVQKGKQETNPDADGASEMPVARMEQALRRGAKALLAKLSIELPQIDWSPDSSTVSYPEWDVHLGSYRPDWVCAEAADPWRADGPRDVSGLLEGFEPRELRRQLASLGLSYEMHRSQQDGSDLDVGRLIDLAIDLRTGYSPAAVRVYRASRCTRRDLAVAVVLDVSGSTGETGTANHSLFDKQLQVAYHLGNAFDALGDTVEIFGFHSWGRKLVRWLPLKAHDESWSGAVAERFAQLDPAGYTRMGAAIRHADRLLRHGVRLPHRLIILVTDGFPYDQDYESVYAEADTRKALEEARAAGTACVCLCVGSQVDTGKLTSIFGAANILAVDEPAEITYRIRASCRSAFAAVFKQKMRRSSPERGNGPTGFAGRAASGPAS